MDGKKQEQFLPAEPAPDEPSAKTASSASSAGPPEILPAPFGLTPIVRGVHTSKPDRKPTTADLDAEFADWWRQVPQGRKVGLNRARKAYEQARRKGAGAADLLAGMMRDAAVWDDWPEGERQYIPHPATWLNDGRWKGDPPDVRTTRTVDGSDQDGLPAYLSGRKLGAKDEIFAAGHSLINRLRRAGVDTSAPNVKRW